MKRIKLNQVADLPAYKFPAGTHEVADDVAAVLVAKFGGVEVGAGDAPPAEPPRRRRRRNVDTATKGGVETPEG